MTKTVRSEAADIIYAHARVGFDGVKNTAELALKLSDAGLLVADNRRGEVGIPNDEVRTFEVDMSYLKEGDYFKAIRTVGYKTTIVYGTADMDGHRVSENYGSRVGNKVYEDPEKNYINVKFDHVEYARIGNSSLYERDGWKVYVNSGIMQRVRDYIRNVEDVQKIKRQELVDQISNAQVVLAGLQKRLEEIK